MGIKIRASQTARVETIDGKEAADERFGFIDSPKKVPHVCGARLGICPTKELHLYHQIV